MTKMKIGVIGAGELGGTLIRQFTKAGHTVKMANASGMEKLKGLAAETGASPVPLPETVVNVDVIVISVPFIAVSKLPKDLFRNTPANLAIIDTCNYYPIVSGIIPAIENGMPESVWVSGQIGRPVIKAYNTILYRSLAQSALPEGHPARLALPIAGDDQSAKQIISALVSDSGFDAFDHGSLQDSWRQQPGSPVYCTDLTRAQLKRSIIKAKRELLSERRELGLKYILKHDPALWMDNVKHNRVIYESDLDG